MRNPWTIRHLKEMRRSHFPDILFLMETKNSDDLIVQIHGWLGYHNLGLWHQMVLVEGWQSLEKCS